MAGWYSNSSGIASDDMLVECARLSGVHLMYQSAEVLVAVLLWLGLSYVVNAGRARISPTMASSTKAFGGMSYQSLKMASDIFSVCASLCR